MHVPAEWVGEAGAHKLSSAGGGRILTFYSYKGGVGRTMALAHVGYLAAVSGLRVLMIDWDLEAPGLWYYFRGLLPMREHQELGRSVGILDLLWQWQVQLSDAKSVEDFDQLREKFQSGAPFSDAVRRVAEESFLAPGGKLDLIGAASKAVHTPRPLSPGEALAKFSWNRFLQVLAGGYVLDSLRQWSKTHYDLVLIDSLTGLAESAGVCTMQMADEVVLCFAMNRQNIDGISAVAGQIRNRRGEQVRLHAVPMRLPRLGTPEEADATARAVSRLMKVGGFPAADLTGELRAKGVRSWDGVPLLETLSPLVTDDPSSDPVTINYERLASALIGRPIGIAPIESALMQNVQRRLHPRQATTEYVVDLRRRGEPRRALYELSNLIEVAREAASRDEPLEQEYIRALVDAAFGIEDTTYYFELTSLRTQALEMLRTLCQFDSAGWREDLLSALERAVASAQLANDRDEELALLEEIDAIIAPISTYVAKFRRLTHRRRLMGVLLQQEASEAAQATLNEIESLESSLLQDEGHLTKGQQQELLAARLYRCFAQGQIWIQRGLHDPPRASHCRERAVQSFERGLALIVDVEPATASEEVRRIVAQLHVQLARTLGKDSVPNIRRATELIAQTGRWEDASAAASADHFSELTRLALTLPDGQEQALAYAEHLFADDEHRLRSLAKYMARTSRASEEFLAGVLDLVNLVGAFRTPQAMAVLERVAQVVRLVLASLSLRHPSGDPVMKAKLESKAAQVREYFRSAGIDLDQPMPTRLTAAASVSASEDSSGKAG